MRRIRVADWKETYNIKERGWIQPLENNVTPPGKSGDDYTLVPEEILPCVYRKLNC